MSIRRHTPQASNLAHADVLGIAVLMLCATQSQHASAQEVKPPEAAASAAKPSQQSLHRVEVAGKRVSTTTEDSGSYGAPAASVGSKVALSLRETPQSVSVITQERIQDQGLATLDAALNQATGITVNNSTNRSASLFARGFQVSTAQVDGITVALPTTSYGYSSPDLALYDHVEVLRGSAGLLNGAGLPGAVIGLARKRPTSQAQVQVDTRIGSWAQKRVDIDASAPLSSDGAWRGRTVVLHEDRDFYYDIATQRRTVVYGVLEYSLDPQTRFTVGGSREILDGKPLNGTNLPRYSDGSDLKLPRSTFLGASWNTETSTGTDLFLEADHRFSNDWRLKLSATQLKSDYDGKIGFLLGTIDPVSKAGAVQRGSFIEAGLDRRGLDLMLSGSFEAFDREHEFVLGANSTELRADAGVTSLYSQPFGRVDIFSYNPYAVPEPVTPLQRSAVTREFTTQSGVYGTLRSRLGASLTAVGGLRSSQWRYREINLSNGSTSTDYSDNAVTPFAGVVYDLNRAWSAYASYADVFAVQNRFAFGGDRLPPVTGVNYEVGLKGDLFNDRVNASMAIFRIDRKNIAQRDTVNTDSTACNGRACYVTGGETRSQGVEAEISGDIMPGWNLFAGYTYNITEYVRDRTVTGAPSSSEGQSLRDNVPKHMLRVWSNARLNGYASAWSLGAGVSLQSSFFINQGGAIMRQPGYAIFNARVGYQINPRWSLSVNANNLFDKAYYQRFNLLDQGNLYGDPRNFLVSARGHF